MADSGTKDLRRSGAEAEKQPRKQQLRIHILRLYKDPQADAHDCIA